MSQACFPLAPMIVAWPNQAHSGMAGLTCSATLPSKKAALPGLVEEGQGSELSHDTWAFRDKRC